MIPPPDAFRGTVRGILANFALTDSLPHDIMLSVPRNVVCWLSWQDYLLVCSNSLEKRLPDAMSVRECDTDMKL